MTSQQELQLRKEAAQRGYSPEQVKAFIQFAKSKEQAAKPQPTPQKQAGDGFLKSLIKDPVKELLVRPAVRVAQVGIAALGGERGKDFATKDQNINLPLLGDFNIPAQKTGSAGVKQIAGDAAKSASYLYAPGKAVSTVAGAGSKTVLQTAKAGAKAGGLGAGSYGFGESIQNENKSAADVLVDTLKAGATGALLGGTLGGTTGLITKSVKAAPQAANKLVSKGQAAMHDNFSTLDEAAKTTLNRTRLVPDTSKLNPSKVNAHQQVIEQKFDKYIKQAERAVKDNVQVSPLELAGHEAEKALQIINTKLSKVGEVKKLSLQKAGSLPIKGVDTFRAEFRDSLREQLGLNINKSGITTAKGRISKIALDPADNQLVTRVHSVLSELKATDTVQRIDDAVDAIQDVLYKRQQNFATPVNSQVQGLLKRLVGQLNGMVKKVAGSSYNKSNQKYAQMVGLRDWLNKALGSEATKGGSLMKRVFSPTDAGTKQYFKEIQKLTGTNLVDEATLARLAMEIMGDPRAESLLQQLAENPSKSGIVMQLYQWAMKQINNPRSEAKRVIEQGYLK